MCIEIFHTTRHARSHTLTRLRPQGVRATTGRRPHPVVIHHAVQRYALDDGVRIRPYGLLVITIDSHQHQFPERYDIAEALEGSTTPKDMAVTYLVLPMRVNRWARTSR